MAEYMDMDTQEFRYALHPYTSAADAERTAAELNFELPAYMESFHDGKLPMSYSGFECDSDNIIISALKQHEDSDKSVLRLFEINGADTQARLRFFGRPICVNVGHNAVVTLLEDGTYLNMMEWPMEENPKT